jgi:inward rectifier potassium channel
MAGSYPAPEQSNQEQAWWYIPPFEWRDPYHWIITLSWPIFLLLTGLLYFLLNTVFTLAYLVQPNSIANANARSFWDAFFFSIQTISTIGYGSFSPASTYAHILVGLESWVGLLGFAIVTGLMFTRFSMPTARVLFSHRVVICPFNGVPTLMFRVANQRGNRILEAQVRVSLLCHEETQEGHQMYRFYDLDLIRSETPSFGLTWMVMHPIDPHSPIYNKIPHELEQMEAQLFVTLTGIDETVSQTIHTHHTYEVADLCWNARFVDILLSNARGWRYIDYDRFHSVEPEIPISCELPNSEQPTIEPIPEPMPKGIITDAPMANGSVKSKIDRIQPESAQR